MKIASAILLLLFQCNAFALTAINSESTFPMALNSAGETYQLSSNITCATTCFGVKQNNITLDLNGYTATFGNANNPGLLDPGFESWTNETTPSNWTVLSGTATRVAATIWGNYDAELSATAAIKSGVVTLTAGQTYIYYARISGNSADAYTIRVYKESDDSELSSFTISSSNLYRSSAMVGGTPTYAAATDIEYKPSENINVYLKIVCSGTYTKQIGYADIKPARHSFLVSLPLTSDTKYAPDLTSTYFGYNNTSLTIQNGSIVQGSGESVKATAILANTGGVTLNNVNITMSGNNSSAFYSDYPDEPINITGCVFDTSSILSFNRMHAQAGISILKNTASVSITRNTVQNDPQSSISFYGCYNDSSTHILTLTHNLLKPKQKEPESYGVSGIGFKDSTIAFNTISPVNAGRGILIDGASGCSGTYPTGGSYNLSVYGNKIENIYDATTYEPTAGLNATGIRVRNWGDDFGRHRNLRIYNNDISGVLDSSANSTYIYGLNININHAEDDVNVYDNTVNVNSTDGSKLASGFVVHALTNTAQLKIYNNNFTSGNWYAAAFGGNDGVDLNGGTAKIYSNDLQGYGGIFYNSGVTANGIDSYCNKITSSSASLYPFYLNGTLSDLYFSHNSITNSNSGGYEVWVDADETNDCIFCENGTLQWTGGGTIVPASAPCQDGSADCYSTAGSRYSGPYGYQSGLASVAIGAGPHSISTGGSGSITISP